MTTVASHLAGLVVAHNNALSLDWRMRHVEEIVRIVRNHMPSGAGLDNGTRLDLPASAPERLVFRTSFHHMNELGHYTKWTDHKIVVKPSLVFGLVIKVTGPNHNDIKDCIAERMLDALENTVTP